MAQNKPIETPMAETKVAYLFDNDEDIELENIFDPQSGGKWILFISRKSMNKMWITCCLKYRAGEFTGIKSIKCSTAKVNPKHEDVQHGVIILHCGPADDKHRMLSFGQNIVEKLDYFNASGHVSYKRDTQTALGTHSTGNTNSFIYNIKVPKKNCGTISRASDRIIYSIQDEKYYIVPDLSNVGRRNLIHKKNSDIAVKYNCDQAKSGYWLMVFNKDSLDKKWREACQLYEDGKLTGISSMSITNQFEDKYKLTGTIVCYCGPNDDLELVRSYGENLARLMNYSDNNGRMCYRIFQPKKTLLEIKVQTHGV